MKPQRWIARVGETLRRIRSINTPFGGITVDPATKLKRLVDIVKVEVDSRSDAPYGVPVGKTLAIKVVSTADIQVTNCRIRLEALECWNDDSQSWSAPIWFNPLELSWSLNDGGGGTKTIGARSNRSCDLVAYDQSGDSYAMIAAANEKFRDSSQVTSGKWRAKLKVEADDCLPLDLIAEFDWEPGSGGQPKLEFTSLSLAKTKQEKPAPRRTSRKER